MIVFFGNALVVNLGRIGICDVVSSRLVDNQSCYRDTITLSKKFWGFPPRNSSILT